MDAQLSLSPNLLLLPGDSFSLELGDSTPIPSFLDDEAGSSNHDGSPPTKKGTHSTANVEAQAIFLAE
jgi:hypothetical protein